MSSERPFRIAITNVFGPLNRGDHELLADLLDQLAGRNVEVTAVARDPALCARFFPSVRFTEQMGKATAGPKPWQLVMRVVYLSAALAARYAPMLDRILPPLQRSSLSAIRDADLVIACPGGYLEDSNLSIYQSLTPLIVAVQHAKRLVLAPMSVGPVRKKRLRRALSLVLRRAEGVYVREQWSQDFARDLGATNPVLSNDLAIQRSGTRVPSKYRKPEWISATAIDWSFPASHDANRARAAYRDAFVAALARIRARTGLPIRFILQVESDRGEVEQMMQRLGADTSIAQATNTPDAIREHLTRSHCLLASRFHSAIFALQVGCPVVALSYLPKTRAMLAMYDASELSYEIDDFDPDEVADTLLELAVSEHRFRAILARMQARIQEIGDEFGSFLDAELPGGNAGRSGGFGAA